MTQLGPALREPLTAFCLSGEGKQLPESAAGIATSSAEAEKIGRSLRGCNSAPEEA